MSATGAANKNSSRGRKKESILNLDKYINKPIQVKFQGGREGACCAFTATGGQRVAAASRNVASAPNRPRGLACVLYSGLLFVCCWWVGGIIATCSWLASVKGILKGYDLMVNLVLDETVETLPDPDNPDVLSDDTRKLGKWWW